MEIDTSPISAEQVEFVLRKMLVNSVPWKLCGRLDDLADLREYVSYEDHLLHSRVNFVRPGYLMQLPFADRRSIELREAKVFDVFRVKSFGDKSKAKVQFAGLDELVTLSVTDVELKARSIMACLVTWGQDLLV